MCNGLVEDYENTYRLTGFDSGGNPSEVMYNRIDDEHVTGFHAMKWRRGRVPRDRHSLLEETEKRASVTEEEAAALEEEETRSIAQGDCSAPALFIRQRA